MDLEKRKTVERFQAFSRIEATRHLKEFSNGKMWKVLSNALLQYDTVLKQDNVRLIMCNDFYEGVYVPQTN